MASDRTRRAAAAHKAAMKHVDMLTEAGQELRRVPGMARKIEGMSRGIPIEWTLQDALSYDLQTRVEAGDLIGEVAICELWKRNGRVCYDMDPELSEALCRSKMVAVPGSLFDRIPHINPMVVLPEPWLVEESKDDGCGYVRCFFLVGYTGNALCNTNDPDREGLAILFCYDREDEEGNRIPGSHRDLMPLPTDRERFTVDEAVSFVQDWHGVDAFDDKQRRKTAKTFKPLLQKTFSVITYLTMDNRDVVEPEVEVRRRKKTGKNRKAPDRDPFWVRVGWYVGPALHEARMRATGPKDGNISIPSGIEHGPQHRAGHFKIIWFGPGKKQYTSKWVKPYWTKKEDLPADFDPPTQIVPVNPQRADPLRRRKTIGR